MQSDLCGYVILSRGKTGLYCELFMLQNKRCPFTSLATANNEAQVLARANPGVQFYLAQLVQVSEVATPVVTRPVVNRKVRKCTRD